MKKVNLYADGACSGNPGQGGYGVILEYNGRKKEFSQGYRHTTNNRMELMGIIAGLSALTETCKVSIYSDSKYIVDAINKGWVYKWEENNWIKPDKKKALNVDLWEALLVLTDEHEVDFNWIQGHNGHEENERCDVLAVAASKSENLLEDEGFEE